MKKKKNKRRKERKLRDFIQWAEKYTNKKFLNCIYVRGSK